MNVIKDLLDNLAPKGCPFLELHELFDMRNGYTPSKANVEYWNEGDIPWFRMEDIRANGRVLGHALQQVPEQAIKGGKSKLFPADSILVATSATIGEHALVTVPHISNQRFTSLAIKSSYSNRLSSKFAFYYSFVLAEWCLRNTTTSSFASVDMAGFRKFKFPVPPLEVQEKIVEILDTFSSLEAELEAELEARKKQYEFYRNQLLTFPEPLGVRWVPMGEVCKVLNGYAFRSELFNQEGNGVPLIRIRDINSELSGTFFSGEYDTKYLVSPGEILIGMDGDFRPARWKHGKALLNQRVCKLEQFVDDMNPSFLYQFLHGALGKIQEATSASTVKHLSSNQLNQLLVPMPSREIQDNAVALLEKLESLVSDISFGLPAELNARRKQYKYYRNKLLTFKELSA